MKKILSIILIIILICLSLAFVGCENGDSHTSSKTKSTPVPTPYRNSNIVSYMSVNEKEVYSAICADYEELYTGSYEINGDNLLIIIKTEEWGKYDETWASILQKVNGADNNLKLSFDEYYAKLQKDIPGLNKFEVHVCDLNSNLIFTLPEPLWEVWQ